MDLINKVVIVSGNKKAKRRLKIHHFSLPSDFYQGVLLNEVREKKVLENMITLKMIPEQVKGRE